MKLQNQQPTSLYDTLTHRRVFKCTELVTPNRDSEPKRLFSTHCSKSEKLLPNALSSSQVLKNELRRFRKQREEDEKEHRRIMALEY